MKRMSLLVALALVAGCSSQPNQPSPSQIPVPGKETVSTQKVQLPDTGSMNPHPDTEPRGTPSNKCSEQKDVVLQNLHLAAAAKLPVPTQFVVVRSGAGAIGTEQFKQAYGVEPTLDFLDNQKGTFIGRTGVVTALIPQKPTTDAAVEVKQYAFDPGTLNAESPATELIARFQSALAAGKVVVSTVGVTNPENADKFTVWWGSIEPNKFLSSWSAGGYGCTVQSVRTYDHGRFGWVDIPMIDLGNAAWLGFADDKLVTYSIKSGTVATRWYTVPGIKPLK